MSQSGMSVEELFRWGIRFSIWPSDAQFISKVVVRPRLVSAIDLHGARKIREGFELVDLPQEVAFFVHARDYEVFWRIWETKPQPKVEPSHLDGPALD